ncbi:hypothetical protein AB0O18_18255 [Streptomyces sp. NPDC093224]|uniref:hypothetical protein n=1 Tax=Streptomyces sp. NPDC093224 TaxID=3155198 RepID=UPI00341AE1AF
MTKHPARLTATVLALGAVTATLCGSVGTAHAGVSTTRATLQPHSNVREVEYAVGTIKVNTGPTEGRFYQDIDCWAHGQRVTAGGYTTDVWYLGIVTDSATGTRYISSWVWGGNVNVGKDPSPLVREC